MAEIGAIIAGLVFGLVALLVILSLMDALGKTCEKLTGEGLVECNETISRAWTVAPTMGVVSGLGTWLTVLALFYKKNPLDTGSN
jgi:hypothetical protein